MKKTRFDSTGLRLSMARITFAATILISSFCSAEWEALPIPNPSFEEGDRLPDSWRTYQDGDAEFARTGNRSLYIKNEGPRHGAWECQSRLSFEPDATYRASVWYCARLEKLYAKGKGSGRLALLIFGPRQTLDGKDHRWDMAKGADFSATDNEWKLLTFEFTPPPEVKSGRIWLWSLLGAGNELWFDDFSLEIKRKE